MKSSTERDLLRLKSDLSQATRTMQSACFNLNANIKTSESQGQVRNLILMFISFYFIGWLLFEKRFFLLFLKN